jgi:flagellin
MQIQVEISQLIDEVDRISTSAEFNRLKMLTGSFAKTSKTASMFFHVGANSSQRIRVFIGTINSRALSLMENNRKRSISTAGQANSMIGHVDAALEKLNRQRADLGAYYNRLENTITSLALNYENMMAADSRIRDVDMAAEMVNFTRDQILVQTGTAMLAQANFKPKLVLKLLE